jgi:iron complex transport system substrate-binding protein
LFRALTVPVLFCLGLTAAMPVWGANLHITDDTGQAVVLPKPALRIIALYSAYNEILAEMGLLDRLVGRTKADTEPPEIMAKPSIGTHMRPNVEMILGLQPDLIIQDAGAQEAMPGLEQLKQQGVAVAVFHPTSFDSLFGVIQRLGVLTGEPGRAADLIGRLQAQLAAVAARLGEVRNRPKVFFEIRYPNLLGAGKGSLVNDIVMRAGGVNCLSSPKKIVRLNLEEVIAADPEVYVVQQGPMNPNPEKVSDRPNFAILRAVRNGRVLVVEEQLYSRPSPRAVAAVAQLARFLHPSCFLEAKP